MMPGGNNLRPPELLLCPLKPPFWPLASQSYIYRLSIINIVTSKISTCYGYKQTAIYPISDVPKTPVN